jgi:DNA-binding Lrp family transcriptional regulator
MRKNNKITIKEICENTGLSEAGVKKIIKKLKDDGTIIRVGHSPVKVLILFLDLR